MSKGKPKNPILKRAAARSVIIRGGLWDDPPFYLAAAKRNRMNPCRNPFFVGFRISRTAKKTERK